MEGERVEIYVGDILSIEKIVGLNKHCKDIITMSVYWGNEIDASNTHIGCVDICYNGEPKDSIQWECGKYMCDNACHDVIKSKVFECIKGLICGRQFDVIIFSTNREVAKLNAMKRIVDSLMDTNCCDCIYQYRGLNEVIEYITKHKPLFDMKKVYIFDKPSLLLGEFLPRKFPKTPKVEDIDEDESEEEMSKSLRENLWIASKSSVEQREKEKMDSEYNNFIQKYKDLRMAVWGNINLDPYESYFLRVSQVAYPDAGLNVLLQQQQ